MKYNHQQDEYNETEDEGAFDMTPFAACLLCEEENARCLGLHTVAHDICKTGRPAIVLCANCRETLREEEFLGRVW
jgi:hypothetical protein